MRLASTESPTDAMTHAFDNALVELDFDAADDSLCARRFPTVQPPSSNSSSSSVMTIGTS